MEIKQGSEFSLVGNWQLIQLKLSVVKVKNAEEVEKILANSTLTHVTYCVILQLVKTSRLTHCNDVVNSPRSGETSAESSLASQSQGRYMFQLVSG